jgi:DNA-directed RNA polymerase specialized sigma24 family protein
MNRNDQAAAYGCEAFEATQWSMVLSAGRSGGIDALERLCRVYWPPVFAHLRRQGIDVHQAQDLTQEFFSRLLAGNSFADVAPEKGRFRSFLLASLKHFLINEWKRETALKRGGGHVPMSLDALDPHLRDSCEPRDDETPDLAYDRRWAQTVIHRVRTRMREEAVAIGQEERYLALEPYLHDGGGPAYQETADALGISESAAKSAIFKARRRFGELLRAEIARTVDDPSEVDDEIRHLLAALRN